MPTIEKFSVEFAKALVAVQGEIEGAVKGSANPAFRSKYADLGACWDACREALQKYSIAVLQFPCTADPGYVGMLTLLVYGPTGEVFGERFNLPLKDASNAQHGGSAITYARRYALCSVIGICPEDDDGNAASNSGPAHKAKNQAQSTAQKQQSAEDESGYRAKFGACKDNDSRKVIYTAVKNSSLPEPNKTSLLTEMATTIKNSK